MELHVSGKYGSADNRFKPSYLKAVQQLLDANKCCGTADAEVWDEYKKIHNGAACFRDKPFPQFDNLCKIFDEDRVTGSGASDLGEYVIEETQRNSHVDMEGLEDIVGEIQQVISVNSKHKRPPTDDTESSYMEATKEMKETFKEVGEKLTETIYNIRRQ
ncbi:unnamed protein product [Lactuca virosa]|uniref:Uncharacterized protein n=1 Tax=Lactuca virosa TaxID=75947 RepID=A0AAU9PT90_9ASTR|nr:unnamed protein product [Lactuca virosa]